MEDVQELLSSNTWSSLLDGSLGLSLLSEELLSSESLGVRVESEENSLVSEGVLLLGERSCNQFLIHQPDACTYAFGWVDQQLGRLVGSRQS